MEVLSAAARRKYPKNRRKRIETVSISAALLGSSWRHISYGYSAESEENKIALVCFHTKF